MECLESIGIYLNILEWLIYIIYLGERSRKVANKTFSLIIKELKSVEIKDLPAITFMDFEKEMYDRLSAVRMKTSDDEISNWKNNDYRGMLCRLFRSNMGSDCRKGCPCKACFIVQETCTDCLMDGCMGWIVEIGEVCFIPPATTHHHHIPYNQLLYVCDDIQVSLMVHFSGNNC